jgi:serine/threonine protein kinase
LNLRSDSDQSFSSCTTPTTRSFNESLTKSFALKVIEKKLITLEEKSHEVHTEKVVLSHLCSPYVVKLKSSFHDKCRLFFLLEYIQNGSLADFLKRELVVSVKLAKHFIAEII